MRVKTGYSQTLLAYHQSNTFRIDPSVVPVTIPYILKGYHRTRSILGETCKLSNRIKINGCRPVIRTDLTAAVEHLYRRCRLILWLGWHGISRRGLGGHDVLQSENRSQSIVDTGAHGPFNCLLRLNDETRGGWT